MLLDLLGEESVKSVRLVGADDTIRTLLRYVLLLDGYRVLTARNGREILDAVNHEEVDVILADIPSVALDRLPWVRTLHQRRSNVPPEDRATAPEDTAIALSLFRTM